MCVSPKSPNIIIIIIIKKHRTLQLVEKMSITAMTLSDLIDSGENHMTISQGMSQGGGMYAVHLYCLAAKLAFS